MPRRGELCDCKDGRGRVVDRNLLTQKVTIQLDDSTHTVVCPASEVSVVYLDKYKARGGAGQGDPARQNPSGMDDAKQHADGNAPSQPQKPARQDGQSRLHGQLRRQQQGERPRRPDGEQRPQNRPPQASNRPQQNQNRPPRPPRQDDAGKTGEEGNRPGNRPRRPPQNG